MRFAPVREIEPPFEARSSVGFPGQQRVKSANSPYTETDVADLPLSERRERQEHGRSAGIPFSTGRRREGQGRRFGWVRLT
jgi:hypothetical protein